MKTPGPKANILKASPQLRASLEAAGKIEHFPPAYVLFHEEGESAGVYLVRKGKVLMSVENLPKLNRTFSTSSLLGLPSSFTGRPYSLTAVTVTECDVVHVPREEFLQLMRECPDLCREATDMLGHEVTFIQGALVERHRQLVKAS
jgi:CRP-like cAMP-binding protein